MGLVQDFIGMLFGSDRNVLVETAEVFRENADKAGERQSATQAAALAQFAAEFRDQRSWFDRLIDGINRLPRPMMAFGALGLIVSAMYSPDWFAARMSGLAQVPEPLWWLMGAIVSFYFGARHQAKGQEFQRQIAQTLVQAPLARTPSKRSVASRDGNAALDEWRAQNGV